MKNQSLVIGLCLLAIACAYPVHVAENRADIHQFRERHIQDTSVLYFVDLSGEEDTGFWASLFSLFGGTSRRDETYLNDIAENNPVLKVDVGLENFSNITEEYELTTIPYVVVFHHGEEILRELPSSDTADCIDDTVKELEEARLHALNAHIQKDPAKESSEAETAPEEVEATSTTNTTATTPANTTSSEGHPHPDHLTIVPDFGHLSTNDPAESELINKKPIEDLDSKTGANQVKTSTTPVKQATPAPSPSPRPTPTQKPTPGGSSNDQLIKFKEEKENKAASASQGGRHPTRSAQKPRSGQQARAPQQTRPSQPRGSPQAQPSYNIQKNLRQNAVSNVGHRYRSRR